MYHLATFHHEKSAEQIAGRMELQHIRTGLRGDHTAAGEVIYNLFVSDRQAEDALRLLSGLFEDDRTRADVFVCPLCGSGDVHPRSDADAQFTLEPKFRLQQTSGAVLEMGCNNCGHRW